MYKKKDILSVIRWHPGITTPKLAELLSVSVSMARSLVHECEDLEFYDGNHIRFREYAFRRNENASE
jgi:hypothetical protein